MSPRSSMAVELRYRDELGGEVVTDLASVDPSALMSGSPVRELRWHPRQRHYPGWLWTATTSTLVGYESLLERDRLLLADFDRDVVGIASQPFWVSGPDGSAVRRHAPDYLLGRRDGSFVVVDVKPEEFCRPPAVADVLRWTGRLCATRGWRYEVFHGSDPTFLANVRFLTIGRRKAFLDEGAIAALLAVPVVGLTLAEAEGAVGGDPRDVRAAALALLWRQIWMTDLSRPLSSRSVITAVTFSEDEACRTAC